MEELYSAEELSLIDEIVIDLVQNKSIDCRKYSKQNLMALEHEGWIKIARDERREPVYIMKTKDFSGKLFSEQYYKKLKQNKKQEINIYGSTLINSQVAQGNNINQQVSVSWIETEIDKAIQELNNNYDTLSEEIKDAIANLVELKGCVKNNQTPGRALLKSIFSWGKEILSGVATSSIVEYLKRFFPVE